ncbi:MAG: sugar-binding protein [Planctomycetota bacterium]|jgi:hypothetical protein
MERFRGIAIILVLAVAALPSAAPGKAANVLLQEGLYAEEVDGDLDAAIRIYQQIIKQADAQRPHVAQAMYRLGMCHLKKQDEAQARAIFARLVADYGDQTKVVDKVKPMLDELSDGDPAALMPPETLLYVEIGSPGKQVETILKMLKGTPFENPLAVIGQGGAPQSGRSYGTALPSTGGGRSSGYSEPGPQNILAGLLNPSMMAEFKKIRGVGIGVTGITENDPPVIVVLYPGKSDALKGLLMAGLTMLGTPGESIEGMQTVLFGDGGGAAYDDTTVIIASPKAHQMGQLIWSVKQHKGLTSEPTLASSNSSFARLSRKDRQDNMLTLWANVDEIFTGLKEILPAEAMPEQYRMADSFVDFGNVDDLTAFVLLEENRIAIEANVAFKDGRRSMAYNMIRTPNLSKAAFYAVPSDAVALLSVATPEADSAQAQMLSGKLKEMTGFEIGGVVFANIDQITLFALPPGAGQAVPGIPPILKSLGVVVTSDDPQQTRQILTGFLMAANMVASQSSEPRDDGRYWIELANKLRIHGYESQAGKATVLSLNPGVTAASVSAIASRKSVADAGPLKEAVSEMSSKTSKLALINVGGMMDFIKADENMNDLVTQLADTCDKTTVRFRTHEEQDNLNVRTEITELPPVGQVIGPAMELAKLVSEEKARQREQARIAKIPASVIHTTEPPEIDGKAEDLWSGIRRHKMVNPAYAPPADRADLTAFYRAMWDDDNLYVLVNVMDESLKNDSDEFWLDDSVEVFIDADNSKSDEYGDNDYQYYFEWAETSPAMGEYKHDRTDGVEFAVGRAEVGYRVEIKFPWSTLGVDPSLGAKLGLDVHVNDDDDGQDRDTKIMWRAAEDNTWQSPRALGIANLCGMVAWWKLDETAGRSAADSSGNDNTGKLVGDPKWLPSGGRFGGALQFDGVGDYVDCGRSAELDIANEITIAAWVKTNDSGNSEFNPYITKGDAAYGLKHHETNNLEFVIYDQAWHVAHYPVNSSFNGAWHHLVGTYDGEALKLYVDGELKTTTPCAGCFIATNDFNINIARNSEITERLYDGVIEDVRLYNYALSADDIGALYIGDN